MPPKLQPFVITVLAGVNGAGKSSIGGAYLQQTGGAFYNPDLVARVARLASPALTAEEANAFAWRQGKERLESAIANQTDYNFETTLGGETMTKLLSEAAKKGATLNIWFAGLVSVELHLQRVASRVKNGRHTIPKSDIRKRWIGSHMNLIKSRPQAGAKLRRAEGLRVPPPRRYSPCRGASTGLPTQANHRGHDIGGPKTRQSSTLVLPIH